MNVERRPRFFPLFLLLLTASPFAEQASDVVALVDGTTSITRHEIDSAIAPCLARIAAEEEQIRREVLQQPVRDAFIAALAQKASVHIALQPARTSVATDGATEVCYECRW